MSNEPHMNGYNDLLPRPHELYLDEDGPVIDAARLLAIAAAEPGTGPVIGSAAGAGSPGDTLIAGIGASSEAWRTLRQYRPEDLPAEGYILRIGAGESGVRVTIAAADEAGLAYGREALKQLGDSGGALPTSTIRDWPTLPWRGVVEGFYGRPWSHQDRLDSLRFGGEVRLNNFVYAPKDDPYHRDRWRQLYPEAELAKLSELAAEASTRHIRFVYSLAPGLSMRFSEDGEHQFLVAKAEQLWQAGVRSFALLFDDVPAELTHPADIALFGADAGSAGAAHGLCCTRFQNDFLLPHGLTEPLLMCPTDYAGCAASPYRTRLSTTLPVDAVVFWTGADIVVGEVTRADIDAAAASYGRRLLLWDNFPVNDFDRTRLFLGPLQGRTKDLQGSALDGISSNPMGEAAPSRFSLATVADWAWNPGAYEPADSTQRALTLVAGTEADALAPLVTACSSWPPTAPQSAALESLTADSLGGDGNVLSELEGVLRGLAESPAAPVRPDAGAQQRPGELLREELQPWLETARDVGRAGLLACRLLRALETEPVDNLAEARDELRAAQTLAETHYPNVLRSIMPGFVATVLNRAALEQAVPPLARRITVLIGPNPAPGDRDLVERLTARGFAAVLTTAIDSPAQLDGTDLVIVTRGASVDAAQIAILAPVPLIAWGHLVALGLAAESAVPLTQDTIDIVAPAHPLAAGLSGRVQVYRGPGKSTWGIPSADASILTRGRDPQHPVIAHYPAGATLPDGTLASAARLSFFLGSEGLAPWLISAEGHALLNAAVDYLAPPLPR